jgi:hypothetical protein
MDGWTETDCEPRMIVPLGPGPRMTPKAARREGTVRASQNAEAVLSYRACRHLPFAHCLG